MQAATEQPQPSLPTDAAVENFMIDAGASLIAGMLTQNAEDGPVTYREAIRLIACHRPTDDADFLLTVQMIAFTLAGLRTLSLSQTPGLSMPETIRMISTALTFSRLEERTRRQRKQRTPLPIVPALPEPEPAASSPSSPPEAALAAPLAAPLATAPASASQAGSPAKAPANSHSPQAASGHSPQAASGHSPQAASGHAPQAAPGHAPQAASGHAPQAASGHGSPHHRPAVATHQQTEPPSRTGATPQEAEALRTAAKTLSQPQRPLGLDDARRPRDEARDIRPGTTAPKAWRQ